MRAFKQFEAIQNLTFQPGAPSPRRCRRHLGDNAFDGLGTIGLGVVPLPRRVKNRAPVRWYMGDWRQACVRRERQLLGYSGGAAGQGTA